MLLYLRNNLIHLVLMLRVGLSFMVIQIKMVLYLQVMSEGVYILYVAMIRQQWYQFLSMTVN